jgi:outer membrane protein assembly factor BamB
MKRRQVSALVLLTLISVLLSSCQGGSHGGVLPVTGGVPVHKQSAGDYAAAVQADHPTQYFQLNETSGPTAIDSSATGINGTYIGQVSFGAAGPLRDEPSTGIALPGGSASVGASLPNPNAASGTSYSIVTWVNPTLASSYMAIWGYNGTHRLLVSNTGQLLSQFSGNFFSKGTLTSGQWHQVVFVYNAQSSTASYYIDGTLDSSAGLGNAAAAFTSTYYLGQFDTGAYYKWRGGLGQHAFFNTALTSTQIAALYTTAGYGTTTPTPSPSPTSASTYASAVLGSTPSQYFKLIETAGPTAFDSSTTTTNGTYVGAVTFGVSGPLQNESSTAISLPGGSASVGVSLPNPSATTGKSYSIATWIKPVPSSSFMTIWGYNGTHRLLLSSTGQLLSQFNGGFSSKSTLAGNQWHFVVFVYNAQTATESYYIDGVFDSSASLSNAAAAFTSAYYLGQYDTGPYYKWNGGLAQHTFFSSALTATQIANLYSAAGYGASPTPSPVPAYTDWSTYGDGLARTNYNVNETTLSASNVSRLQLTWAADLGAAITAQPIVATNVPIGGTPTTVLYIGTEGGVFYALNADTGKTIWSKPLATVASGCMDLPGGTFGITGTATFDKSTNRVYVADGHDQVHAFDMSTGAETTGWPVTVVSGFTKNHIYSALTYNPANKLLYASTASFCDQAGWIGTIVAIDTTAAAVVNTFIPSTPYSGAGIWGIGGAAVDSSNNIYISTGNAVATPENAAYGDQVVKLTANLQVISAAKPPLLVADGDFGATPMLYQPASCPALVTAKQKSGFLYTWNQSNLSGSPVQSLQMANSSQFIGVTAYSPITNMVYVGNPRGDVAPFTHGISALSVQPDCTLALAWQQTAGPQVTGDDNNSPTLANGVVYLTDGIGNQVFAYDASSGQQLWSSGSIIGGPVMSSPTVDGRLFVPAWDHKLYAFSL